MANVSGFQVAELAPYSGSSKGSGPRQVWGATTYATSHGNKSGFAASQVFASVVYATVGTRHLEATTLAAQAVVATSGVAGPHVTEASLMAVYGWFTATENRSRAWTFTLDGHTFYVLDLGQEGTFLYDVVTQQWSQFRTDGFVGWNMRNGAMFGDGRIAGSDVQSGQVWELDPDTPFDEGFRDIEHIVTGALQTRSRVFMSCDSVRLAASVGSIGDPDGAIVSLRVSDDLGHTWKGPYDVHLVAENYSGEIVWRSLGSFMAPGRIFQITDVGGMIRIDGADAFVGGYDNG